MPAEQVIKWAEPANIAEFVTFNQQGVKLRKKIKWIPGDKKHKWRMGEIILAPGTAAATIHEFKAHGYAPTILYPGGAWFLCLD